VASATANLDPAGAALVLDSVQTVAAPVLTAVRESGAQWKVSNSIGREISMAPG
jgi:hypothetical protein